MSELTGEALLDALEAGEVRAAERLPDGSWRVNAWIKEEILELFRASPVAEIGRDRELWPFLDKAPLAPRRFERSSGIRLVPGGSAVRRGAFVGMGCVLMPPCYVNVGAHVGAGTMIDSHVLVGSCAQIGERVHLSAGVQIGGVLEPAQARPVIVEDGAFLGGQCGLYEGVLVRRGAVLGAGVILTGSSRVFDLVGERELFGTREQPLEIPENSVVVPGSRPLVQEGPRGSWAALRRLHLACAILVKYRDARTDARTALEDALR